MIIWLASYPRSGNTLLRIILKTVFERDSFSKHDDVSDIGADSQLAALVGHRPLEAGWPLAFARMRDSGELHLVKTHDPPESETDGGAGKAIYIVRDGRAVCRSYWHYLCDFSPQQPQYSLRDVVSGFVPFGSWGGHLDSWNPEHRPGTLLVGYEQLLNDPAREIQRIAEFTGMKPLHDWQNQFEQLQNLNPKFFRAGAGTDPSGALGGEAEAIFWPLHGDWMRQLNYAASEQGGSYSAKALRQRIAEQHREEGSLRELHLDADRRLQAAEQSGQQLHDRSQEQLLQLRGQLSATRALHAELQNRIDEQSRRFGAVQKQAAISLQENRKTIELLGAAAVELNTRMRMLLTSRLLHLGWKLGLGSTPYWADLSRDEVAPVMQILKQTTGSKSPTSDSLRRVAALANSGGGAAGNEMDAALHHLVEKGFKPSVVLDVGAAKGYWSVTAAQRWPGAEYFMIDPLPQSEPALREICKESKYHYLLIAVGSDAGTHVINLPDDPDGSSLLEWPSPDPARQRTVTVETLDRLLEAGSIKPPQLVKLDVQGFELHALRGGSKLFDSAEVFIIETSLFEFMPGCPRLHQVVQFMADRGCYPFDVAGALRRPFQNDLAQVDIVFVRKDSPLVASSRWLEETEPPADIEKEILPATEQPPEGDPPKVSVIICTKDPRTDILDRALDSIDRQTLARNRFEVIVVDNGSSVPLNAASLAAKRTIQPRVIAETQMGLSRARCAGIVAATGDLLVFVDDDNFLDEEYLTRAAAIAISQPRIGLFGGISVAEHEAPIPKWKQPVLPYLGIRDDGPEPITAFADHWGEWEPIGAGMVARRPVADEFVRMYQSSQDARQLGRSGESLLSGEDSLFARAAHRIGYSCSYQPALRLVHFIKSSRMKPQYLARLMLGHGRSFVLLHRATGKPTKPLKMRTAIARLIHRVRTTGRAGFITWFWDLGYAIEKRHEQRAPNGAASAEPIKLQGAGHVG